MKLQSSGNEVQLQRGYQMQLQNLKKSSIKIFACSSEAVVKFQVKLVLLTVSEKWKISVMTMSCENQIPL